MALASLAPLCALYQVRELASELGVDVEPAGMAVIDHFSHDPADPSHATVVAANFVDSKAVFGGRSPVCGAAEDVVVQWGWLCLLALSLE